MHADFNKYIINAFIYKKLQYICVCVQFKHMKK